MRRSTPTGRQYDVLQAINELTNERGFPPSVREIGLRVGLSSSSTVQAHLRSLERCGLITRDPTKPRALVVHGSPQQNPTVEYTVLPIIGRVAAGVPIHAVENREGELVVPLQLAKVPDAFVLRVVGDSMIEAAILDGDLIIVHPQPQAQNGEIVVALLDGEEVTVKRFYREQGRIRLQPENRTMQPIYAKDVKIVGRVAGLMRHFN